jgi:hypothetical protein
MKHNSGKKLQWLAIHYKHSWQPRSRPEVARYKPHVSVGGLLEHDIFDKSWESHRNGSCDILAKEQCTCNAVGEFLGANTQKEESS